MNWAFAPVWDPRVRKWRIVIHVTNDDGTVQTYLPIDGWTSEQEARTHGYALMMILQKKAQQHA